MAKKATKTKALTKDQLFGSTKTRLEPIEIPELGGTVYLAQLTAAEILPFINTTDDGDDDDDVQGMNARQNHLLVRSIVDENGERLLGDEDAEMMNQLPWDIYTRIVRKLQGKIQAAGGDAAAAPLPAGEGSPSS